MAGLTTSAKLTKTQAAAVLFVSGFALTMAMEVFLFKLLGCDISLEPLFTNRIDPRDIGNIKSFYQGCLTLLLLVWVNIGIVTIMLRRVRTIRASKLAATLYAMIALWICLGLASITHMIATNIYGHIPSASGGGEPVTGRLILNKDGEAFWLDTRIEGTQKSSELAFRAKDPTITARSRVVRLYYEDEHIMVVEVDNSHGGERETVTMILSKSLVDAFITDRKL
jgi:hypothetical protein